MDENLLKNLQIFSQTSKIHSSQITIHIAFEEGKMEGEDGSEEEEERYGEGEIGGGKGSGV